jgi:HPr kinase/phosphorylase
MLMTMFPDAATTKMIHASCVALSPEAGVLIRGASGAGKSALALNLLALGAVLVADDQTIIEVDGDALHATAPVATQGLIEARGAGILRADVLKGSIVKCIVDLDRCEEERLPPMRKESLLGCEVPLYYRIEAPYFAAALIQVLKGGRAA